MAGDTLGLVLLMTIKRGRPMLHRTYPREKHTPLSVRLIWRLYYQIRRVLPARTLLKMLLNSVWTLNALSWEQTRLYESSRARKSEVDILRPNNVANAADGLDKSHRVCDFGGGLGDISSELVKRGCDVVYCDTNPVFQKSVMEKFNSFPNFRMADSSALVKGQEGIFDLVILSHVLEHIENPTEFLNSIRKMAIRIHVEVPDLTADSLNFCRLELGLPVYRDDDHVIEMSLGYLKKLIEGSGFEIESIISRDGCLVARAKSKMALI